MLTEKQQYVLDIITKYIGENAKSPTIEELTMLLNQKSKRGVVQYLEALEKKGFLTRGRGYRSINLGNSIGFQTTMNIPILGYANAGTPLVDAVEAGYGVLPISKKIISGDESNYFILKVEGTSMNKFDVKGKTIENGSYVLIKKDDTTLNNRDAFLFLVNGSATLKKYKKDTDLIYLLPESNDTYHKPIILSEDDNIMVNGKVVDVFMF
ncbi:MAG: S24 family peptidase [Candidatus Gracilibacteria bacterium]|nr:S24 family peptidase [Candidatus Gracilibacteria bacterium]